jgi:hypothetical protein
LSGDTLGESAPDATSDAAAEVGRCDTCFDGSKSSKDFFKTEPVMAAGGAFDAAM